VRFTRSKELDHERCATTGETAIALEVKVATSVMWDTKTPIAHRKTPPKKTPVEMVKDVYGRKGDSVCSTTMELVSRSLRKCKVCKEDVNTKDRFREHSHIDHRVSNSVVIMKDVITSPLVILSTPQPRVFLNIQGNTGLK
jgi:hypothetical protein